MNKIALMLTMQDIFNQEGASFLATKALALLNHQAIGFPVQILQANFITQNPAKQMLLAVSFEADAAGRIAASQNDGAIRLVRITHHFQAVLTRLRQRDFDKEAFLADPLADPVRVSMGRGCTRFDSVRRGSDGLGR